MRIDDMILALVAMALAVFGGTARFVNEIGQKKFNSRKFLQNTFLSAFVGFVVVYFCIMQEVAPFAKVILIVTLSGFVGTPVIYLLLTKLGIVKPTDGK